MLIKIKKIYKKVNSHRKNPKGFANMKLTRLLPSTLFIRMIYAYKLGKQPNLKNPQTFNDKLQWMKLHYRNPLCTDLADKYKVREYVAKIIGKEYLIPLLGVYSNANEIDFDELPNQFVLKCNNDSGGVIICKDKKNFDVHKARQTLNSRLKKNHYYRGREWQYKNIDPKIICEKYMSDGSGKDLMDYKFFCFDGHPKLIQVHYGRFTSHKKNSYDTDWNYINVEMNFPTDPSFIIKKPNKLDEMLNIASKLSKAFPHVRVDFYYIRNMIYFGEMTFCNAGGFSTFSEEEFNYEMGSWLKLPVEYLKK